MIPKEGKPDYVHSKNWLGMHLPGGGDKGEGGGTGGFVGGTSV